MDVNGESADRNCRKETRVLKLVIAAARPMVAQSENRYLSSVTIQITSILFIKVLNLCHPMIAFTLLYSIL